ncbi:MAG: NYN domain-containing protein, partial [Lachnospiraceae bacterium]|nr:NYN domain-containing protein [Candidatus Equihabitans merdae]
LASRRLVGGLTGSELTDIKITLIGGRAHEKHTEGGDFYQAADTAVRQGLMQAENILLEPWYDLTITVPMDNLGRLLNDLSQMQASFGAPEFEDDRAILKGLVSVSAFGDYGETLSSYTKGEGLIEYRLGPYKPCPRMEDVVLEKGYDPDSDKRHPSGSVFCQHGVGTIIPWYDVPSYAHVECGFRILKTERQVEYDGDVVRGNISRAGKAGREDKQSYNARQKAILAGEDELKEIFERTYGPVKSQIGSQDDYYAEGNVGKKEVFARTKRKWNGDVVSVQEPAPNAKKTVYGKKSKQPGPPRRSYLLVDGYNMIFAWKELHSLADADIKAARDRLMEILSAYGGCVSDRIILVFDAYKVSGGEEHVLRYHNISVVFTREAETADQYIEKAAKEMVRQYDVTVATSDGVEQMIIFGAGARRLTAAELEEDIARAKEELRENYLETHQGGKYFLQNNLSEKLSELTLEEEDPS